MYKKEMFRYAIKRTVLYKVPNCIMKTVFFEKIGVNPYYEMIKSGEILQRRFWIISLLKLCLALFITIWTIPFVLLYYVISIYGLNRVFLPRIEVCVTTFCSLNCESCSNLMQYYKRPYHIDAENIIESISNVLNNIDYLDQLIILGGEPFVYPELESVIEYAVGQKKIGTVEVISNGVWKPKPELFNLLKNPKIWISISDYGVKSDIVQENCKVLKQYGIAFLCQNQKPWFDMGDMSKRGRSGKDLLKQYEQCEYKCKCILNGRLYICPRASHGSDLNLLTDNAYVDLFAENLSSKMILDVYYREKPIVACDYCDAGTELCKKIPCGIQAERGSID